MGNFISYELLPIVFNMSVTASAVIVFVLLARLLLKKAPKIFSYALWAVVLFRLLCPVSIITNLSLLGLLDAPVVEATTHTTAVEYIPQDVVHTPAPEVKLPVPGVNHAVNKALPQGEEQTAADPLKAPVALATLVWLAGIGVLAAYSVVSLLRFRRRLVGAVLLRDNVYLADYIESPFVMGILRPKIYLPSSLSEQEQGYIILHEQHHIRRGDHIIKALAFFALCIHWFNPMVWVAFVLSSKDMEMSCDEAVVRKLGEGIRADYSASLLSLATGRRIIAGTPLAFGEGDTKNRIKNMLNWKKAKPAVLFLAAAAVILSTVVCATNQRDFTRAAEEDAAAYLYRLKGAYHWDKKRIEQMVPALETDELGTYTFYGIYRSEGGLFPQKCYELTLKFANEPEQESAFNEEMEHRAAILLGLIGNLEQVTWEYPLNDDTMTAACFYSMLNQPVEALGNETIEELCKTEDGLRALLEHWGLSENPTAEETLQKQGQYGTAEDVAYYLELSAIGKEFRDMGLENKIRLLEEYEDLLDDYALVARESTDGKSAYIVGSYNGNIEDSPLYMMVSTDGRAEVDDWCQILYRKADSTAVEEALAAQRTPSTGYRIEGSWISFSDQNGIILIQPRDTELSLDVALRRYLYTPNGRDYIKDAASRGVDMCSRTEPFLYVYRISESYGEIAERFSLTEAEASTILAEKRQTLTDGFGFAATLHMDGETVLFSETSGVPRSVLDLAVEKCDYKFADPSYIRGPILGAELDCNWLDSTLHANEANLPRLEEILKNAEFGAVGDCGYGARLTLSLAGGEKLTVFKGTDDCGSLVFGSYGGYFIGDKENSEFWEMFGLDPVTKAPIEANSNGRELLYKDEEILITVPEKYAHLVKMDGLYSDEQYTNKANFYYEPEYFEHRGYAAPLNGGWMLTISTTLPSFAENTWAGHNSTYWTKDGTRVYVEQRPTDSFNCTEANLAEFKAVMNSIQVEYIGLEPFAVGISLPTEQLSTAEHSAAVDAIFTNLKTGWWNGEALKSCVYESAAFECLYRKADANISRLYGYGGYFRWGRDKTCVEYWYAPTIVTLDTDTQQVLDLWWPGDGAAYESSILNQFPEAIASTVAEPNSGRYAAVRARLMEASKEFMVDSSPLSVPGATRRFGVQDLRLEITNVLSTHKTSALAEGIELHEYVVVSCTPESKITVLDAGMSDPSFPRGSQGC